jgi:hypothetical protein
MEHVLTNEMGGYGNMGWVKAVCSCGWKGTERYAYDDRQYTDVGADREYHLRTVRTTNPEQADTGEAA